MKRIFALLLMLSLMYVASAQKSAKVESAVKLSSLKQEKVVQPTTPQSVTYNLDIRSEDDNKTGAVQITSTALWKGTMYEVYQHQKSGKLFIIVPNTKDSGYHRKYIKTD